jgi:hypothetical protein
MEQIPWDKILAITIFKVGPQTITKGDMLRLIDDGRSVVVCRQVADTVEVELMTKEAAEALK